jgi:hypothetical protein
MLKFIMYLIMPLSILCLLIYFYKLYKSESKSEYNVFVFDLDQTITNGHTGGFYKNDTYKQYISDEMLLNVKDMFRKIKLEKGKIYINSRGIASNVRIFCNDSGLSVFIDGIYAATHEGHSTPEPEARPDLNPDKNIPTISEYMMSNHRWDIIKSIYLMQIVAKENIDYKQLYYFDDTKKNIEYAKYKGFRNSYIVDSNKYPNPNDEYNLINCFNSYI